MGDDRGSVEAIYTAPGEGLPVVRRERVAAMPGVGLDGDRYATGLGHWSGDRRVGRDVTLVEAETIEDLGAVLGTRVGWGEVRRNLVTRAVRLNDLVGVRFRIGEAILEGTALCEPCTHLERVTGRRVLRPLVHRGGLRANLLTPGELRAGAPIELDVPSVGVGIVVLRAGRYLLGRRKSRRGDGTWSIPGGEVALGESVLACALRELAEETTLVGEAPRVVGQCETTLDDGRTWRSVFVAVDVPGDIEPAIAEPERCAAWGWFEPRELPAPLFPPAAALLAPPLAGTE